MDLSLPLSLRAVPALVLRPSVLSALLFTLTLLASPDAGAQVAMPDTFDVKPPLAVEIDEFSVVGSAAVGDRFVVQVRYSASVTGPGLVSINLPDNVAALGNARTVIDGLPLLQKTVQLVAETGGVVTFPLRVTDPGPLMIEAQVRALDPPENVIPFAWQHLEIESRSGSATVRNPRAEGAFRAVDPRDAGLPGTDSQITVQEDSPFVTSPDAVPEPASASVAAVYQFNVSGRVIYQSPSDGNAPKGVYGAKIRLFVRRSGSLFHPITGNSAGVHYVVVGEGGQYDFSFAYDGVLSSTDELVAFVSSATPTIRLMTDVAYTFYDEPYFSERWVVPLQGYGTNINIARDAVLPSGYGATLRYTTLAREAVDAAYYGSPPVSTAPRYAPNQSDIYVESVDPYCGTYSNGTWFNSYSRKLTIDPDCTEFTTVSHEYGHWLHEALVGRDNYNDADRPAVTEGWATFHSFAARGRANSRYGDSARGSDDDLEVAPYNVGYASGAGGVVRFSNVRYARGGSPEVAALASFLWAVYDGPSDQDRETTAYDIGDNEDVVGQPLYAYDALRLGPNDRDPDRPVDILNAVLARTPASLDPSVSAAYTFMHASLTSVPPTPVRSVQAGSLSGQALSATAVQLTWSTNQYPYSGPFVNVPDGYRIYRGGSLVATVSNTTTTYTYNNTGGISGTYTVTAYNAAGESTLAPSTTVSSPLSASISGPSILAWKQQGTYTAGYSGGSGTVSYLWSTRSPGASTWNSTGVTAQTYTLSMLYFGGIELQVGVTRGSQTAYATKLVSYCASSPCLDELAAGSPSEDSEAALKASGAPALFAVHAPRPNPTRGAVEVRYDLPEAASVSVVVYDATGREVARLVDGWEEAGYKETRLDRTDLPSGVYLVRVQAGPDVAVHRLTVIR